MNISALVAVVVLTAGSAAVAQSAGSGPMMGPDSGSERHWGYGSRSGDWDGMMGPGTTGPGMMRMMLIAMDTDGDGALSLEEMQAVHARVFTAMDADGDGRVMPEEMEAFMHGEEE